VPANNDIKNGEYQSDSFERDGVHNSTIDLGGKGYRCEAARQQSKLHYPQRGSASQGVRGRLAVLVSIVRIAMSSLAPLTSYCVSRLSVTSSRPAEKVNSCENIFAPVIPRPTDPEGIDALARRARNYLELVIAGLQA
jgi:hypothetical protein